MASAKEGAIAIQWEIAAKLNFACHQCAFSVLRDLRIENRDEADRLDDVVVTLVSNPGFIKPKSWRLDRIAAGGTVAAKYRDVELDGGFLLGLTDAMMGQVSIRVEKDGEIVAEDSRRVELLAYNEWGGAGYMPELLAAFSMPNDPAVDRLLHRASSLLRRAGRPEALDGYRSGSRQRVWEMVSAIYSAVANLGITYAVPPASFERDGQKIRIPCLIEEGKVATCLDTALLFASAFEQAGLNPIVALPRGHAVVGVWLQPEELSTIVIEDAEILRKRCRLKELVLIETTFATAHPAPPFSRAVNAAMDTITDEHDATFGVAVDIRRARALRISPLALKGRDRAGQALPVEAPAVEPPMEAAPALPDFDQEAEPEAGLPETPAGRLERWQRKLLDLSARNPLLNHRSDKTSLRILCPDPGLLEDKLAAGGRISIESTSRLSGSTRDAETHKQRTGEVIIEEYAREALRKGQVLVDLLPDELSKRAVEIYRKAQTALQEGGANTLFLALGFLSWKRDVKDERRFRAPLILLPVTLQRQSVRSGVQILAHDDEPRFNPTLLEMLRKDFEIDIRGLDAALPQDESGVDVRGIWEKVRRAVKDAPGFEMVEDVVLGHFSFAKFLMWKDLVDRTDVLRENKVVRHLLETPRHRYKADVEFIDKDTLDRDFKPSDLLAPLPTDASQLAAIATADRGKDFILIGPPGTGKSQTIANMICHLMGKGKTVLFVSEKTAALEVVYRRLSEIGLGRHCLQLHSNKAKKSDVLSQLRESWAAGGARVARDWEQEAERLRVLRDKLNRFVDHLHRRQRNGLTAHYAIGVKVRDQGSLSRVELSWPDAHQHDERQLAGLREAVELLAVQAKAVGTFGANPLQMVSAPDWSYRWESRLIDAALALADAARAVEQAIDVACKATGVSLADQTLTRLDAFADFGRILVDSYGQQTAFALEPDGRERLAALEAVVQHLKVYAESQARLSCSYDPMAWRSLDGGDVGRRWAQAQAAWWPKSFFAKRAVLRTMRAGGAHGKPDPATDGPVLAQLREEGEAIDQLDALLSSFDAWRKQSTDPEAVQALHDLGDRARTAVVRLVDDPPAIAEARAKVRNLLHDGNDLLAPDGPVGRAIADYFQKWNRFRAATSAFEALAACDVRKELAEGDNALELVRRSAEAIIARRTELNRWCAWRRRRSEAMDLNLAPLVSAIERELVRPEEIPATFEAAYCGWWSARVIDNDEVLRTFSSAEQAEAIQSFRQVDAAFQKITADYVAARLSGDIPPLNQGGDGPHWGILRNEIAKKKRHMPLRMLMQQAARSVTTLAPCLMMSPLSVAQYLPADHALFDVVIFDEASQIAVWDAVGSIARGRQVVVAGDPKQMPPTNFFNRSDDDPAGEVDYEGDLDSILDELRSAGIPEHTLTCITGRGARA